jgi:hypothetical protein
LEYEQNFVSILTLTRTGRRIFRWTEANISCSNHSVVATCKHIDYTSSTTHLQLIGGGKELGGPSRCNLDTPRLMVLEDLRAGAAFLEVPILVPCTTKSCRKLLALSSSRGLASATSRQRPAPLLRCHHQPPMGDWS